MSLVPHVRLDVAEVLCHLAARSNTRSQLGGQLDNLASRASVEKVDPLHWGPKCKPESRASADLEGAVLMHAGAFGVVGLLGQIRRIDLDVPTLFGIAKATGEAIGTIVVRTLRAYQEALCAPTDAQVTRATARAAKATASQRAGTYQRAVAEYQAPRGVAAVQALYTGKNAALAASLYADCYLVLAALVARHNRGPGIRKATSLAA